MTRERKSNLAAPHPMRAHHSLARALVGLEILLADHPAQRAVRAAARSELTRALVQLSIANLHGLWAAVWIYLNRISKMGFRRQGCWGTHLKLSRRAGEGATAILAMDGQLADLL